MRIQIYIIILLLSVIVAYSLRKRGGFPRIILIANNREIKLGRLKRLSITSMDTLVFFNHTRILQDPSIYTYIRKLKCRKLLFMRSTQNHTFTGNYKNLKTCSGDCTSVSLGYDNINRDIFDKTYILEGEDHFGMPQYNPDKFEVVRKEPAYVSGQHAQSGYWGYTFMRNLFPLIPIVLVGFSRRVCNTTYHNCSFEQKKYRQDKNLIFK